MFRTSWVRGTVAILLVAGCGGSSGEAGTNGESMDSEASGSSSGGPGSGLPSSGTDVDTESPETSGDTEGDSSGDTSPPLTCDGGALDPGEACDGSDLGGETCASQGFTGGTLACTASCEFDTSGCFSCAPLGFDDEPIAWTLPDYGPGIGDDGWFEEGFDRYSDGLNWSLRDLDGDESPDLLVHDRDQYVMEGPTTTGLGRTAWRLHTNTGDGFDGDGTAWSLPDYGASGIDGAGWFREGSDRYSDGLNWSLLSLTGSAADLVVHDRDQYVMSGPTTAGLGRTAWRVHANAGDGFDQDGTAWSLPDYGDSGIDGAGWFHEGFDRYSDGLNWSLVDLDGDGAVDLVVQDRDQYVTDGPTTSGLGRTAWRVHLGGEDGFSSDGMVWGLPDYGPGFGDGQWFEEGFDRYSDGLNWSLVDLTGDGRPDLVVHDRDQYVTDGPTTSGLGRTAWRVHENTGDGFDAEGVAWSLPDYGPGFGDGQWFEEGFDRYSDGLNWSLRDLTGDGALDLLVHDRDQYVTDGPTTNGLGRTAWRVHENTGDGFDADGTAWPMPDYGPGIGDGQWFEEGSDRYSDGLNWTLAKLSPGQLVDAVVQARDQYVTDGPALRGLGRQVWQVHRTRCE